MSQLSVSEVMAERIYELFRTKKMGEISFIQNYINLAYREDISGVMYLTFLLSKSKKRYVKRLLRKAIKKVKI